MQLHTKKKRKEKEKKREKTINKLHNKSTIKSKWCEAENIMID